MKTEAHSSEEKKINKLINFYSDSSRKKSQKMYGRYRIHVFVNEQTTPGFQGSEIKHKNVVTAFAFEEKDRVAGDKVGKNFLLKYLSVFF